MASVNSAALNMLTREQAEEAARIIDAIGFVSNDLGANFQAVPAAQEAGQAGGFRVSDNG